MATQRGKCTNFGNCLKADSGEFIDVPVGGNPVCPLCSKPLTMVSVASRRSPLGAIIGLLVLLLLGYFGWKALSGHKPGPVAPQPANSGGGNFTPAGGAGSSSGVPAAPGDALMYYERSDEKWLQQSADDYNKQHPGTNRLVLDYRGSREGKQDILYGKGQPVLWNPADTYWIDKLNMDWTNPSVGKHSEEIVSDSRTILSTRYVLVMRKDRADVFTKAMSQPQYRGKTWSLVSDIATKGWGAAGGPSAWGKLKLIHSDPTKSNGGQVTLALMFAEYSKSHPGATPQTPGFLSFMRGIEGCVVSFPDTTSKCIEAMLKGSPDQYDIAVSYEINAIAAVDKGATDIRVIYPDPTVSINFPGAVLKAPWVTDAQAQMGKDFIDYLMTRDVQLKAIDFGFRPALADTRSAVDDALSKGARGNAGFQLDPLTVDRPVGTKVIDDLLYQWFKIYGGGGAAPA